MAFDLVQFGGYGSGTLGDVTDPTAQINSVATVNEWTGGTATIYVKSIGIDGGFKDDSEVLFYIGGISDVADGNTCYGRWCIASISMASGGTTTGLATLSLNGDLEDDHNFPLMEEVFHPGSNLECFAVSVPHFKNLTLNSGCYIAPVAGYPLAFKCSGTLTLNGGHIDLRNKGSKYRPWLNQEINGKLDTDLYSGWENSQTKDRLTLNAYDGAVAIIANKLVIADNSSRIGNPDFSGVAFCRGASDSRNLPTNASNIGGSTIFIAAGTITNFTPAVIAKYRNKTGTTDAAYPAKGLARCYIASNTLLRNDEGLYAYDCISNPSRLEESMNIKSFGNGSDGSSSLTTQLNNYAKVTAIDATRKVLTVTGKTSAGAAPFKTGALVMFHMNFKTNNKPAYAGKFFLAKILGINGDDITIDTALPATFANNLDYYACQLVTIPQFSDYSLYNKTQNGTPAFDGDKGGIFAVAVKGTCNISGGKINVEGKGGGRAYRSLGLSVIGNAQNSDKLPVGEGHGSVFILAKNLELNSASRIGATYSGAVAYDNRLGGSRSQGGDSGGGYSGSGTLTASNTTPCGGYGGAGGTTSGTDFSAGGYGSNGEGSNNPSLQGAHIMIIADTISGFNQAAISTGGDAYLRGNPTTTYVAPGTPGSAGYGGGGGEYNSSAGGYSGGGGASNGNSAGGASGWAFVYCNNVIGQDTEYTTVA